MQYTSPLRGRHLKFTTPKLWLSMMELFVTIYCLEVLPTFFSCCEKYNLLLPLLRNGSSLIDPFVYWRFLQGFIWINILILEIFEKIVRVSKARKFVVRNMKSFQRPIMIKKTAFQPSKYESNRSEVFCKNSVLRNFAKFTRKHLRQSLLFNKIGGWGLQLY